MTLGTLNFDILLRDHIDGYRRLGWNGWCENLKPIVTNLKKLSPKNRVSWGLQSTVVCQQYLHKRHCKEDITVLKHCPSTCEKRVMWVGVGVGVDFSKPESESESQSLKFGRLRSPGLKCRSLILLMSWQFGVKCTAAKVQTIDVYSPFNLLVQCMSLFTGLQTAQLRSERLPSIVLTLGHAGNFVQQWINLLNESHFRS